jgi:hypothetical protein
MTGVPVKLPDTGGQRLEALALENARLKGEDAQSLRNRPASDVAGGIAGVSVVVDPGRNVEAG